MSAVWEICKDVLIDGARMIPFLLFAFLLIELVEKYTGEKRDRILMKGNKAGRSSERCLGVYRNVDFPWWRQICMQSGLSRLERFLLCLCQHQMRQSLLCWDIRRVEVRFLQFLGLKVVIAIVVGYLVDLFCKRKRFSVKQESVWEERGCSCCGGHDGILKAVVSHSLKTLLYIMLFSMVLNVVIEGIGIERIQEILMNDSPFQIILSASVG